MSLKILIVDDHRLARSAIRTAMRFCRLQPQIVGEATDGATAIELARQLAPDVITMDITLPDMNGLEVTRRLNEEMPQIKVVMVTMHEDREYREAAAEAGAVSYVTKDQLIDGLAICLDRLTPQCLAHSAEHEPRRL